MVAHKHHGFLAVFMNNIHHFLGKLCNLAPLESLEIPEFLRRNSVSIVHITLINNKFGAEFIADLFFKLL